MSQRLMRLVDSVASSANLLTDPLRHDAGKLREPLVDAVSQAREALVEAGLDGVDALGQRRSQVLQLATERAVEVRDALVELTDPAVECAADVPFDLGHHLLGQATGAGFDVLRQVRQAIPQLPAQCHALARSRLPQRSQSGLKRYQPFADLLDDTIERSLLDHLLFDRVREETIDARLPAFCLTPAPAEQRFFRHTTPTDHLLAGG